MGLTRGRGGTRRVCLRAIAIARDILGWARRKQSECLTDR